MGGKRKPDVSGWATRYNVTCADGLTLAPGAFARNDGGQVPVVFQHNHQSISNVLGHALVKDMPEGVIQFIPAELSTHILWCYIISFYLITFFFLTLSCRFLRKLSKHLRVQLRLRLVSPQIQLIPAELSALM